MVFKRVQGQCMIWKSTPDPNPDIPVPINYRWKRDCDKYTPVMTILPLPPETLRQLVKYGCSKSVCETSWCRCKAIRLYCTELCCCGAEEESCKILPVINMLMTFDKLFSFGFRHFFSYINK